MPTRRFAALPGSKGAPPDTTDKYVVFKRQDLIDVIRAKLGKPASLPQSSLLQDLLAFALDDAVVIRRQDMFAAPALNSYASCIAIAIAIMPEGTQRQDLLQVADYFSQQAELAADEGYKLPTP